ncbi:MAG: hypothetical protein K8R92_01630 [Planctomycetes bacterium]|nr:hypothetical protein [Planctomycetota bacterium]
MMPTMEPATATTTKPSESSARRTILLSIAIILTALLGVFASRFTISARGTVAPDLFLSTQPAFSIAVVLVTMIVAFLIALPLSRHINAAVSLFVLGCAFATYAMQAGTIADLVFLNGSMTCAAIETLLWSAFISIAAIIIFRVGGPLPDVPAINDEGTFAGEIFHKRGLLSLLAGIAAIPVLIFTLVGPTKGQSIGACVMAGIVTAVIARLISPRSQPILLFAVPAFVIGAAQLVLALSSSDSPDIAFGIGTLSPLRVPMPMDIAAGSLCGVAIGLGWSKGLVKKDPDASPLSG